LDEENIFEQTSNGLVDVAFSILDRFEIFTRDC